MHRRTAIVFSISGLLLLPLWGAPHSRPYDDFLVLAQQQGAPAEEDSKAAKEDDSPEAIMARRFPQKVRVGDLIGLPVLDGDDVTLGGVRKVVRTPEGKIKLIVSYSKWFGWFGRPVAVPIEVVVILGRQIDSLEWEPEDFEEAPTWTPGKDQTIPDNEIIRIAIGRR